MLMVSGFSFVALGLFTGVFLPASLLLAFSVASMSVYVILTFKIAAAEKKIKGNKVDLSELGEISTFKWSHLIVPLLLGVCMFIALFSIISV